MNEYQNKLKKKMNEYAHFTYKQTKNFPKQEIYGSVSQWRRAALSVVLNYIEGYARRKTLVRLNFLEISYGSLMESIYLLNFSNEENFLEEKNHSEGLRLTNEIGAMLWTEISKLEKNLIK
ncbi:MAG: four helix bundle protein [Patescibacteria group bacterium]|jgi:four helix bundle protein